jgi:hypothetical protein
VEIKISGMYLLNVLIGVVRFGKQHKSVGSLVETQELIFNLDPNVKNVKSHGPTVFINGDGITEMVLNKVTNVVPINYLYNATNKVVGYRRLYRLFLQEELSVLFKGQYELGTPFQEPHFEADFDAFIIFYLINLGVL